MSLYLSRLCLNPLFAPALKLAADPYELHRKLLDTVPCRKEKGLTGDQPKTADLLFRVDASEAGPVVLIQTTAAPDWEALEVAPRALRYPPQTKPLGLEPAPGQRLAFRLLCQPSVRKSGQFGQRANGKRMPGPRRTCRTDEQRLEWLRRKAAAAGFMVESVGLTTEEWRNTKRLQARGGAPIESYDAAQDRALTASRPQRLGAVRFDGVLVVTDPVAFREALISGIGPAKAFGFGLLSVAPV